MHEIEEEDDDEIEDVPTGHQCPGCGEWAYEMCDWCNGCESCCECGD